MKKKIDTEKCKKDINACKGFFIYVLLYMRFSHKARGIRRNNRIIISFFYHSYWDGSNSLVQAYNQQMKERIQGVALVVF